MQAAKVKVKPTKSRQAQFAAIAEATRASRTPGCTSSRKTETTHRHLRTGVEFRHRGTAEWQLGQAECSMA